MTTILKLTKGDAANLEIDINQDLTGWDIRAELWDTEKLDPSGEIHLIRKASIGVVGGNSNQILITNATLGQFTILINSAETVDFTGDTQLEIEIESPAGRKITIFRGFITMDEERIMWDTTTD